MENFSERAQQDGQTLLGEARWLHDYYLKLGESAQQRAIAALAFGGVLIALVPSALPKHFGAVQFWLLVAALASVLVGLVFSAWVLLPGNAHVPSDSDLRDSLNSFAHRKSLPGSRAFDAVHALTIQRELRLTKFGKPTSVSVIEAEARLTRRRMNLLKISIGFMVWGLGWLVALLVSGAWNSISL